MFASVAYRAAHVHTLAHWWLCVIVYQLQPACSAATQDDVKPLPVNPSKKWAGRRRPTPYKPAARHAAMDKIAELVDEKKTYYEEKLKMRRAEHCVRMEVLKLKEEYYKQLLPKLSSEL